MSDQLNRVKFTTASTGSAASPIAITAVYSASFLLPSDAGAANGRPYSYIIVQGADFEVQELQAYSTTGPTIARGTPVVSKISGSVGTSRINIDNTAVISFGASARDLMFQYLRGADIASASTLNLDTATGECVDVTGTTTVTAITLGDGQKRWVRATGAHTYTHGSSLLMPGAVNYTTAAGDYLQFRGYASSVVRCVAIQRINGKSVVAPASTDISDSTTFGRTLLTSATVIAARTSLELALTGQCRLVKNGSNLELQRFNGRYLWINGALETVPASPVTLSTGGLSASLAYYIYAFMSSGTMTLEASGTATATDSTYGHKIKSGDATRTLVGMGRTNGSTAWSDTSTFRGVASYFNRHHVGLLSFLTANSSGLTSATYTEVDTGLRLEFMNWADEAIVAAIGGYAFGSVAGQATAFSLVYDTSNVADVGALIKTSTGDFNAQGIGTAGVIFGLSEGYHLISLFAKITSGSGSVIFGGDSTAGGLRTSVSLDILG